MTARVILVDDHPEARSGIRSVLSRESDLQVVGEAASGVDGVALCRDLQPDLVILDLRLPDMHGLAVMQSIKLESPATTVLVMTLDGGPAMVGAALGAGADGYVLKGAPREELLRAIRDALKGDSPIHPGLAVWLLDVVHVHNGAHDSTTLTDDELHMLQLRATGQSHAEIARTLSIGANAVGDAMQRIADRFAARFSRS